MITVRYWMTDGRFVEESSGDLPRGLDLKKAAEYVAQSLLDPRTRQVAPLVVVNSPSGQVHLINTANLVRVSLDDDEEG
jgi:hypothetical protein